MSKHPDQYNTDLTQARIKFDLEAIKSGKVAPLQNYGEDLNGNVISVLNDKGEKNPDLAINPNIAKGQNIYLVNSALDVLHEFEKKKLPPKNVVGTKEQLTDLGNNKQLKTTYTTQKNYPDDIAFENAYDILSKHVSQPSGQQTILNTNQQIDKEGLDAEYSKKFEEILRTDDDKLTPELRRVKADAKIDPVGAEKIYKAAKYIYPSLQKEQILSKAEEKNVPIGSQTDNNAGVVNSYTDQEPLTLLKTPKKTVLPIGTEGLSDSHTPFKVGKNDEVKLVAKGNTVSRYEISSPIYSLVPDQKDEMLSSILTDNGIPDEKAKYVVDYYIVRDSKGKQIGTGFLSSKDKVPSFEKEVRPFAEENNAAKIEVHYKSGLMLPDRTGPAPKQSFIALKPTDGKRIQQVDIQNKKEGSGGYDVRKGKKEDKDSKDPLNLF
jgi:hypothetical protein